MAGWWGFTAHAATYVLRTGVAPSSLFRAVETTIAEHAPSVPVSGLTTGEEIVRGERGRITLLLLLLGTATAASLLLAAVGVFGVAAAAAQRRTREIGIRVALGARQSQVRRLVLGQSAWLFVGGAGAGIALTLVLGRFVRSLLFGVAPTDPVTLLAATALVLATAFGAAAIPAWRAARVDPMDAIRVE